MQQLHMQISKLPLQIIFAENGKVAFQKLYEFATIVDSPEVGVQCIMDSEGLFIRANTEIPYGQLVSYNDLPELKSWLIAQQMDYPL